MNLTELYSRIQDWENIHTEFKEKIINREELLRLFQSVESLFYDEIYVMRTIPDDLDEQAIKALFIS